MKAVWLNHLSEASEQENFKGQLKNNQRIWDRFNAILKLWEEDILRSETTLDDFTGSWAVKQAYRNGQKANIRKLRDLINFSED